MTSFEASSQPFLCPLPLEDSFLPRRPLPEKLQSVAKRAGTIAVIASSIVSAFFRIDSAANPVWEAGLGRPGTSIEHIVNEALPSDTLITIATTPGFNANYDDMAKAIKGIAQDYNARLIFARNGNKHVEAKTIAQSIFEDMPKPHRSRFSENVQDSILILDGHSMGGKTALLAAAWLTENHPDVKLAVVLDSTPNSTADVEGFFAQSVVKGLSVAAPRSNNTRPNITIGPGTRFIAESMTRLFKEPARMFTDKTFVLQTLADKYHNLGANQEALGNSALAAEADIINTLIPREAIALLMQAKVPIIRLSPDQDTTVNNESSVAAFEAEFGKNFCNLPVYGATHGSPNEQNSHAAYMKRWDQILSTILGIAPRSHLSNSSVGRILIPAASSAIDTTVASEPLAQKCTP